MHAATARAGSAVLSFCERRGIGSLRSRPDGSYTLVWFDPLALEVRSVGAHRARLASGSPPFK
jgi:hypothetical protein